MIWVCAVLLSMKILMYFLLDPMGYFSRCTIFVLMCSFRCANKMFSSLRYVSYEMLGIMAILSFSVALENDGSNLALISLG